MVEINTKVELIDSKLYKYKSCTITKLKTYLHSKGHTNTISKRVFLNFIFPITFISYNGLKGYISQTNYKSRNVKIKLIKTKGKAADYII